MEHFVSQVAASGSSLALWITFHRQLFIVHSLLKSKTAKIRKKEQQLLIRSGNLGIGVPCFVKQSFDITFSVGGSFGVYPRKCSTELEFIKITDCYITY